jgi:hypothetical protein
MATAPRHRTNSEARQEQAAPTISDLWFKGRSKRDVSLKIVGLTVHWQFKMVEVPTLLTVPDS